MDAYGEIKPTDKMQATLMVEAEEGWERRIRFITGRRAKYSELEELLTVLEEWPRPNSKNDVMLSYAQIQKKLNHRPLAPRTDALVRGLNPELGACAWESIHDGQDAMTKVTNPMGATKVAPDALSPTKVAPETHETRTWCAGEKHSAATFGVMYEVPGLSPKATPEFPLQEMCMRNTLLPPLETSPG